jgi:transporter family protein
VKEKVQRSAGGFPAFGICVVLIAFLCLYAKIRKKGDGTMWFIFALLSAVFAALTSILAKVGIDGVNSNLATAIRTVVVVVMAWGMVFLTNTQGGILEISKKSWLFLILSGLATGASWLCYYRALQIGEASKVVPIDKLSVVITLVLAFVFLHEKFTVKSLIGCILIGLGTLVMVL